MSARVGDCTSLPPSLAPRGLSRVQASEYIGVGPTKFDELVAEGVCRKRSASTAG